MNLETPQPNSYQSGIGLIRGWVCDAEEIELTIDNRVKIQPVYGNLRSDTKNICGDKNNGFEYLINWNEFSNGLHTLRAKADGIEFAEVQFTVTTFNMGTYLTGLTGTYILEDFPIKDKETEIQWSESNQNFVISNVIDRRNWKYVEDIIIDGYRNAIPEGTAVERDYDAGTTHLFILSDQSPGISYGTGDGYKYTRGCFILGVEAGQDDGLYHSLSLSDVDGARSAILKNASNSEMNVKFFIMDWHRIDNAGSITISVYRKK
jgi:hypothetical protein